MIRDPHLTTRESHEGQMTPLSFLLFVHAPPFKRLIHLTPLYVLLVRFRGTSLDPWILPKGVFDVDFLLILHLSVSLPLSVCCTRRFSGRVRFCVSTFYLSSGPYVVHFAPLHSHYPVSVSPHIREGTTVGNQVRTCNERTSRTLWTTGRLGYRRPTTTDITRPQVRLYRRKG